MTDYDYPETDTEQLETAASIWGNSLEDYDLVMSASKTAYVNVENETYELVSVCGQPGLFSNGRLTEDDIPLGLFLYHLRSDGNGVPCSVESRVTVNHGGCIVTSEPLELGTVGHILFDNEHSLDFLDENLTFGQFMTGDFESREVMDLG